MFVFIFLFSAYAFAELIDNALAATAENEGPRNIEIRLVSFAILSLILKQAFINVCQLCSECWLPNFTDKTQLKICFVNQTTFIVSNKM